MISVYVYYRVNAADAAIAMQALAPLGCAASRRVDDVGEWVTVMERYALHEAPSAVWLAQMHERAQAALGPMLRSDRHTEVFEEVR